MNRLTAALAGTAMAFAWAAAPAQAAPLSPAPAVFQSGKHAIGIEQVSDRHWRHRHRHRDHWRPGAFGLGFALGFGAPYVGSYAYPSYGYAYPPYPYGYTYAPAPRPYYSYPAHRYGGPGLPLDYREN